MSLPPNSTTFDGINSAGKNINVIRIIPKKKKNKNKNFLVILIKS
tara:strand:+ start:346 stop:480 length:135 start_codon:yes stop_codon:yes gene_type:complete